MAKHTPGPRAAKAMPKVSRRFVGLYVSGHCSGPGWGNAGYVQAVYEVTEWCGDECRVRVENGPACREYGEGYDALVALYVTYQKKAEACERKGQCGK
jgi:hypothetical protein